MTNIMKKVFQILSVFFFLASCSQTDLAPITIQTSNEDVTYFVEIADTEEKMIKGLMYREHLNEDSGMIFVFERDQILSFWMKNTPHPLSIAYIDSTGTIRDIFDMTPFSLSSVTSTVSVRYALEVPKGWFEENGIKTGDKVSLPE